MKTLMRLLLSTAATLLLYKALAILYEPCTVDLGNAIYIRKYAWIASTLIAYALAFVEDKLCLFQPKSTLCEQCEKSGKAVAIALSVVAVIHLLSAFLMPNDAEIFNPTLLLAALLEEIDFLEAMLDYLNESFFMLDGMYFLVDVYIVQQIIFSFICHSLFCKWHHSRKKKSLQTAQ